MNYEQIKVELKVNWPFLVIMRTTKWECARFTANYAYVRNNVQVNKKNADMKFFNRESEKWLDFLCFWLFLHCTF